MITERIKSFDQLPDSALLSVREAIALTGRCRSSLYRDHEGSRLEFIKVGNNTKVTAGELRRYMRIGGSKPVGGV